MPQSSCLPLIKSVSEFWCASVSPSVKYFFSASWRSPCMNQTSQSTWDAWRVSTIEVQSIIKIDGNPPPFFFLRTHYDNCLYVVTTQWMSRNRSNSKPVAQMEQSIRIISMTVQGEHMKSMSTVKSFLFLYSRSSSARLHLTRVQLHGSLPGQLFVSSRICPFSLVSVRHISSTLSTSHENEPRAAS